MQQVGCTGHRVNPALVACGRCRRHRTSSGGTRRRATHLALAADGGDRISPADRQAVDEALQRLDEIGEAKAGLGAKEVLGCHTMGPLEPWRTARMPQSGFACLLSCLAGWLPQLPCCWHRAAANGHPCITLCPA